MSLNVSDVVRFDLTWGRNSTTPGVGEVNYQNQKWMNRLHYMVFSGEAPWDTATQASLFDQLKTVLLDFWKTVMPSTISLEYVRLTKVLATPEYDWDITLPENTVQGGIASIYDEAPCASACIVRKSFVPGRPGIGRVFVGPLCGGYTDRGTLTINPATLPDFTTVQTHLGDPLNVSPNCVLKPCIIGYDAQGRAKPATGLNIVRVSKFSLLISYLRSRRPGKGI